MLEKLKDIIVNYVEVDREDIKPESRFMEDLGFTSYDLMCMLGQIEEELDVCIEDEQEEEVANIHTVQEAIKFFEQIVEK